MADTAKHFSLSLKIALRTILKFQNHREPVNLGVIITVFIQIYVIYLHIETTTIVQILHTEISIIQQLSIQITINDYFIMWENEIKSINQPIKMNSIKEKEIHFS